MPIAKANTPSVTPTAPVAETVIETSREVAPTELITEIDGYPWQVNYYSQLLGSDDEPNGLDLAQSPVNQQYHLVQSFELSVDSAITYEYLKVRNASTMTGSAHILPKTITPTIGDVFSADIGLANLTLFVVTSIERLSHFNNTAWMIEYRRHSSMTSEVADNLTLKTVKQSHFRKGYLEVGASPILEATTVSNLAKLGAWHDTLLGLVVGMVEDDTLYVPVDTYAVYDGHHWDALRTLINITEHRPLYSVMTLSYHRSDEALTLWDALISIDSRTKCRLGDVLDTLHPVSVNTLPFNRDSRSIHYTDVEYVMEVDTDPTVTLSTMFNTLPSYTYDGRPLITSVVADDYYVLSEAFYSSVTEDMSLLELCVSHVLNGAVVDLESVLALCEDSVHWADVDRFYFYPIMLLLIAHVREEA